MQPFPGSSESCFTLFRFPGLEKAEQPGWSNLLFQKPNVGGGGAGEEAAALRATLKAHLRGEYDAELSRVIASVPEHERAAAKEVRD